MEALRGLPKVDRVVQHAALDAARRRLGQEAVTKRVREALDSARARVRSGEPCPSLDEVASEVARAVEVTLALRTRAVINATGVLLHTNLGRAPLADCAARALAATAARYASIEIDLATGKRGGRGAFVEHALAELTGAEAAFVVNNNAAATLLALTSIVASAPPDKPARVLVSRGELVEIGGGFRVPDVLRRSGAELVEVGTTNKTRISDYARALEDHGKSGAARGALAILRVHPGNFMQTGFVERPLLRELAAFAKESGLLLIKDLGGGALMDLSTPEYGLAGEPVARDCIAAGCDLVCFSGDKVLGGPQSGAIVGRADLVSIARKDPLARALRLGRLPLVALEATLGCYLEGRFDAIPALRMMSEPVSSVRARVETWWSALRERGIACAVVDLDGAVGAGALAEQPVKSAGLSFDGNAEALAARLRHTTPAVLGRIQAGALVLDGRTVLPGEEAALISCVVEASSG